jgi:hypothetical protein
MSRTSQRARRSSPLNLPGAFELFTQSRKIVLDNLWVFGPVYAVPVIFGLHSWIWTPANSNNPWYLQSSWAGPGFSSASFPVYTDYLFVGVSLLWGLFVLAAGFIVQIMAQKAQLDGAEGHQLNFAHLWTTVKHLGWRLVGLYLLVGLYIVVGLILFIIPGIIMIRRYSLAPYVMMDKKTGIRESMEISAAMTKPYSGSIYRVYGVMVLIGLIAIIPRIGWLVSFVLGMLYSVALALRYTQLKQLVSQ